MPPILYFFALCNLVIGSSAFALNGILQPVSTALGISVAAAGQVMTAYAIATAVLAPLFIVLTARWPKKRTVQFSLALFTAGCLLSALAPNLLTLLMGRALMGAGAMFTATASALAVTMVSPALRGRALSTVFMGMSISYAVGLPLGAWLGFEYGWRVPMWLSVAASLSALVAASWLIPSGMSSGSASFAGFRAAARQGAVLRIWLRTLLSFVAIFSVFTYIGPVLLTLNPMGSSQLAMILVMFGLAGVVGSAAGGWASDRFGAMRTIQTGLVVLIAMLAVLPFTAGHMPLMLLVLAVWAIFGFGLMSPQQSLLASLSPAQAPLLLSLNSSMLYIGTALGAIISGAAISHTGFAHIAWVGTPFGLAAVLTLLFDRTPQALPVKATAAVASECRS